MFAVEMSKTNNNIKHIAVAGNIGSGKTTLANLLSKHYGWEVQLEDMDDNPYITDFYDDMQRWSFNLQVYFLNIRFNNVKKIRSNNKTVIQDRTIYEDARIFAPNLHAMGLMSTRDYENYMALFESLNQMIKAPDLLIYLRGSIPTLVKQIQLRGRDYEDSIRLDYLKRLNERYEAWISTYNQGKVLILDIDEIDFANDTDDANQVINKIEAELNGLF
jgi:deoxyadenosine/deoxycytidine kinase